MSPRWETTALTAKMGLVLLGSANAASTECALHAGRDASQRKYVGAWGKSCLFLPCANFPDLAVESMWELSMGLVQGHIGAPAYKNW